ncbi:hypothetical protein N8T08_000049 [Aspergillus melleus]|uniref:Uncharacterized protein n=1 Tax=Aspergillus melleus TaxID=138277 RepID=A0ACC3BGX0_9EURO|nr:hypothetical protein N8T08_000049 [Aspergillus melleus]
MNPRIGVGVFILNAQGNFILGRRKGSHGAGTWGLPGGHLEFGESFEDCAAREVLEETGLNLPPQSIRFLTATNDVMAAEEKHYVTCFVGCKVASASGGGEVEVKVLEPEKCEEWQWVSWEEIEQFAAAQKSAEEEGRMNSFEGRRLFMPIVNLFEQRKGFHPARSLSA